MPMQTTQPNYAWSWKSGKNGGSFWKILGALTGDLGEGEVNKRTMFTKNGMTNHPVLLMTAFNDLRMARI
jgi:hypothetical protein